MEFHLSDNSHQKEYQPKHSMKMHLLRINGIFRIKISFLDFVIIQEIYKKLDLSSLGE